MSINGSPYCSGKQAPHDEFQPGSLCFRKSEEQPKFLLEIATGFVEYAASHPVAPQFDDIFQPVFKVMKGLLAVLSPIPRHMNTGSAPTT